jgi:DNA-binding transcriptional ArsR family regulator
VLSRTDLIIHPVRLRIVSALAARPMTTRQLAAALPDVAQATLYRQVHTLLENGAIEVTGQRTVNGIVESTYATRPGAARFERQEFAAIPPEEHARGLGVMLGTQVVDAERYFKSAGYDTTRDGMTYFRASLALTNKEARQLRIELLDLVARWAKKPRKGRRIRHLAVSSIPEPTAELP